MAHGIYRPGDHRSDLLRRRVPWVFILLSPDRRSRMRAARLLFGVIAIGASLPAASSELYVVRVGAASALNSGECVDVSWRDNVVLYNSTADPLTVRLLEVSNG